VTSLQDDKIALSMKYVSQGNGEDLGKKHEHFSIFQKQLIPDL
jgi:hypothetical protein